MERPWSQEIFQPLLRPASCSSVGLCLNLEERPTWVQHLDPATQTDAWRHSADLQDVLASLHQSEDHNSVAELPFRQSLSREISGMLFPAQDDLDHFHVSNPVQQPELSLSTLASLSWSDHEHEAPISDRSGSGLSSQGSFCFDDLPVVDLPRSDSLFHDSPRSPIVGGPSLVPPPTVIKDEGQLNPVGEVLYPTVLNVLEELKKAGVTTFQEPQVQAVDAGSVEWKRASIESDLKCVRKICKMSHDDVESCSQKAMSLVSAYEDSQTLFEPVTRLEQMQLGESSENTAPPKKISKSLRDMMRFFDSMKNMKVGVAQSVKEVHKTQERTKKRGLSQAAKDGLEEWFYNNLLDPYPSQEEKERLAQTLCINVKQVNYWVGSRQAIHD